MHGRYPNRARGRPRLVSALVYLNARWDAERWGAHTRVFDPPTGAEARVTPAPGRLLLLDQDATHAVSAPSALAGASRARYSLVWKLALFPKEATAPPGARAPAGGIVRLCPPAAAEAAEAAGRRLLLGSAGWWRPADGGRRRWEAQQRGEQAAAGTSGDAARGGGVAGTGASAAVAPPPLYVP